MLVLIFSVSNPNPTKNIKWKKKKRGLIYLKIIKGGIDFGTFLCNFFYFLSVDRNNASRDLKNFLEVVRNMPDTLPKFGGIWFRRFRDLAFPKLIFFRNRAKKSMKILENIGKSLVF